MRLPDASIGDMGEGTFPEPATPLNRYIPAPFRSDALETQSSISASNASRVPYKHPNVGFHEAPSAKGSLLSADRFVPCSI